MSWEEGWLSLRIEDEDPRRRPGSGRALLISVPRRIVRQATQRNRIKRLIREVARRDHFFRVKGKTFRFYVRRAPDKKHLKLGTVQALAEELKEQHS